MLQRRGWMWLSLILALVIGASGGVIADRIAARQRLRDRDHRSDSSGTFVWFTCDGRNLEDDPAYPYRSEHRDYLLRGLRKRLDLDPDQVAELQTVLEDKRQEARLYWTETRDSYCRMQSSFRGDIRALLRADQAATFDELLRRVDEHHRQRVEAQHPIAPHSEATDSRQDRPAADH